MAMIKLADDFFERGCGRCERFDTPDCSAQRWREGIAALRALCREAGLVETAKWGHPCYMHAGRNIALIGAFRDDFRLNFMDAALLNDPAGVLEKQGDNSQQASAIRFTTAADVHNKAAVIQAYLHEAKGHAEAGTKPVKQAAVIELPPEMHQALAADPALAQAFERLTPGRQRSYAILLNGAKKPETRIARIAKSRDAIMAGKGANEQ